MELGVGGWGDRLGQGLALSLQLLSPPPTPHCLQVPGGPD